MDDWRGDKPALGPIGGLGWLRVLLRIVPFATVTYGGLVLLLACRVVEVPFAPRRPVTPYITQAVCRLALMIMGLRVQVVGRPMRVAGAVVANHASWLDIFVLNACDRVYFVSKAEVARWPGIGWLARATGTVFIARDPAQARVQQAAFEARLRAGHRLLFFPEGTSTDSLRVLPFKSTLFAAFFTHGMEAVMHIQPVSVRYFAPKGADARFYGWWGDMDFAPHLLRILASARRGRVVVTFHAPLAVDAFAGRKDLAAACEMSVRSAQGGEQGL
ncbi:lyso-ornithine lipid acyltransferase [Pseudorhodobacter antarcticus]|uniref:Lyso-ornithine lipid acyltransferase n=1 Tax=Pseudorhodobacter antarcticus TaxID=1077947 RepID=A0A1H8LQQ0_9RHOB|nr:lysophospholipid acyltransferase family protein [Pseudorhodobacter antarcticus]SEO07146.1 lyso-ornithine lipid acyltransferase [Pseudorhodobacter antarcticus]